MPSRFEISDELWAEVEPLIPARPRRRRYPGREAIDDRLVLNGILHVWRWHSRCCVTATSAQEGDAHRAILLRSGDRAVMREAGDGKRARMRALRPRGAKRRAALLES